MPKKCTVTVLPIWEAKNVKEHLGLLKLVSTVSKSKEGWERDLSPFLIGPCKLYDGYIAQNMENAWQFSKVYPEHITNNCINDEYWEWAKEGWSNTKAIRYPFGRARKPLFSWWDGRRLDYVPARKAIYGPLYAEAVMKTQGFQHLQTLYRRYSNLVLLDFDAYAHKSFGMSLTDVLNNPKKKMCHAFVLAMLLTKDSALKEMELRSAV